MVRKCASFAQNHTICRTFWQTIRKLGDNLEREKIQSAHRLIGPLIHRLSMELGLDGPIAAVSRDVPQKQVS